MRSTVDPIMMPIERRIVRAGGMPTAAPWWTLVVVVVFTIVFVSLLDFVRGQFLMVAVSSRGGAAGIFALVVRWTFGLLRLALIVRIISSWFGMSPYSPWIRWSYQLTEPILAPLRRVVPTLGVIDITPIIAWFLLSMLQWVVLGALT
jgi:YggT family protein